MSSRTRRCTVLVVVSCAIASRPARAEGELLAKAREQLEALDYPAARATLESALAGGQNRASDLVQIYQLRGIVAGAVGDADAATEAFKHLLALSPKAALDEGTSPKITPPFERAAEFFASRKPLEVTATTSADPPAVTLVVASDPLAMVETGRVIVSVDRKPEQTLTARGAAPITIPLPAGTRLVLRVAALDRYGNQLVEIDGLVITRDVKVITPPPPDSGRPLYARWWLWGGLAVALGATGMYFGLAFRSDGAELDDLKRHSVDHRFDDTKPVESSMRRNALAANIGFGAAGVAAIAATYFVITDRGSRSEKRPAIAPTPLGDGAGVTLALPF